MRVAHHVLPARRRLGAALLAVALPALGALSPPALADGTLRADRFRVTYRGDDAPSRLTVTVVSDSAGRRLVLRDEIGAVRAGARCVSVSPSEAACPMPAGRLVRLDAHGGDDHIDASALAEARVSGGDGNDVILGGDLVYGGAGDDELTALRGGAALQGGAGADRLTGSRFDDYVVPDGADLVIDMGAGDDMVSGPGPLPAIPLVCGDGDDVLYARPTVPALVDPLGGPLLGPDCERVDNVAARPFTVRGDTVTFRLRCVSGEFDFQTYHCRGGLALRTPEGTLLSRQFRARDDALVRLTVPLDGPLRAAFAAHAVVTLELSGFMRVASDFGEE
ncbi:MAG TPA: calcium-binding protein, partial [Capillimicrobium sp.]